MGKDKTRLLGIPTAATETIIEKFVCLEKEKWL